jgi:hypothetical protein
MDSFEIATMSPTQTLSTASDSPTPTSAEGIGAILLPHCDGYKALKDPVPLIWPQAEDRIKELEGSSWHYYSCPQPQATVAKFYRENMTKPPYNMNETNWVEREEGTLGVYFFSPSGDWTYLWVIPQSTDPQATYVLIAQNGGEQPFLGGVCLSGLSLRRPHDLHGLCGHLLAKTT